MDTKTREAIQTTLNLHQMVVDGKYETYENAKEEEFDGDCPLCIAFRADPKGETNLCAECPWVTIEKVKREFFPCNNRNYDYDDDIESIERLNCWLEGKPYRKRVIL